MVPGDRSKSAEVTEPCRAAEVFFTFDDKTKQPFSQPFTVFVSQGRFVKKFKKNSKN